MPYTKTASQVFDGYNPNGSARRIDPDEVKLWGQEVEINIDGVTPTIQTYPLLSNATAATIPTSVTIVNITSRSVSGDGWQRTFKRVVSQPAHHLKFQSANGLWFESTAPRKTFLAAGQSNMTDVFPYSWTPPLNVYLWNWNRTEAGVGTAFATPSGSQIGTGVAAAAEYARLHPEEDVQVVNMAWGGMTIDHFIGGLHDYTYSSATTTSGLGTGYGQIRFDNATPGSAANLFVSQADATFATTGQTRVGAMSVALASTRVRVYKASNPAIYVQFDPGTASTVSNWFEAPITGVTSAGTLVNGDAVRINAAIDVLAIINANVPVAMAQMGISKFDALLFRQGEGDAVEPGTWADDYETFYNLMKTAGYVTDSTPHIIYGQVNENLSTIVQYGRMAYYYQTAAQKVPSVRIYIDTAGSLNDPAYWQDTLNIHNNGLGHFMAGRLGAYALSGFVAGDYDTIRGVVTHPERGVVRLLADGTNAEPILGWRADDNTGLMRPAADQIGVVTGGTRAATFASAMTTFPAGITIGSGISFPVAQVASADANTLDDYEEGLFTPALMFGGAAVGMTFGARYGLYVKAGQIVYIFGAFVLTAKGSSTGNMTIGNLPFTSAATYSQAIGSYFMQNMATNWGDTSTVMFLGPAATSVTPYKASTTTIAAYLQSDFTDTSIFYFSGTYRAGA